MKTVHSFDIFDTLLARTVKNPTDIFDIIELNYPYPNFKKFRLLAQSKSNHTIEDIYYQFKLLTNESDNMIDLLRQYELQIEMENTIPIISNILKIQNDDILVSDMYFSHNEIIKLLNYHNINQNIKLYVSSSGKSNGYIWNNLVKEYNIIDHIGDNYHSDIKMAEEYGIRGIYTEIHKFTNLEEKLLDKDRILMIFLRKFRLMNPYDEKSIEYKIYDQQIKYNIPLLLFMCKKLYNILISENRNKVLFLSRDGCLIYKLFSFLYPQFISYYLYSSRIINKNYNNDYINYLKEIYNKDDCILFDLHGCFESGRQLFMNVFGSLPRIFIFDLSIIEKYYDDITYITYNCDIMESFNHDLIGSLIDFKNNKRINMPTEISLYYIKIIHDTINNFIKYITTKSIIIDNNIFNDDNFWINYYNNVVIYIDKLFVHISDHSNKLLTTLANKYNTDKGDQYACAHHYTIKYQEIISNLLYQKINNNNFNNIDLLEIGLNRDNNDSIPSLMMWNEYFNNNINITGYDINEMFLLFNSKYDNINIVIGDQSNIHDLQQLKINYYDIIIDDGYHASKHQQISFKELWSNIKYGGYYIIEDLHYQPEIESCIKTKYLFEQWQNNNWIESDYIKNDDILNIKNEIESIQFIDSQSNLWDDKIKNAFVYIKKIN